MRPTEKTGWCHSGQINMEKIPDVGIRHAQTYRHKPEKEVCRVEYQCLDACRRELFRQAFQRRLKKYGQQMLGCVQHNVQTVPFGHFAPRSRRGTCGILFFAKCHEIQIGGTSEEL